MIRINLLEKRQVAPSKTAPKISLGGLGPALGLLLAVGGVAVAGWLYYAKSKAIGELQAEIAKKDQVVAELNKALQTMDEFQNKKKALEHRVGLISQLKRRQNVPVLLLDMLSRQVPDFLWLDGLDERSGAISLRGRATTYNAVSNFYNNLKNSPFFTEVTLGTTQKVPEGVSFLLSCRFNPPRVAVEAETPAEAAAPPQG